MSQTATLHIKVEPGLARGLKTLAKHRGQTMGELVRQALSSCYQPDLAGMTAPQRQAFEAWRGGFISLGKLAQVMGLAPLAMREWLAGHGVDSPASYQSSDAAHA
jgi:hypothetical protein